MKYKIITFGCQFNLSDSERIKTVFESLGYDETKNDTDADVILVLACSVRQTAVDRLFGLNRKWKKIRENRPLVTILSGCVLPSDRKKVADFFDAILPVSDIAKLPKILAKKNLKLPVDYFKIHPSYNLQFSAYVPIMTGCNNFCAYCVVPYVRGREASRPVKDIISECQKLINGGYKEITLLGQNVNSYKSKVLNLKSKKLGTINFSRLLKLVDEIKGDYWLRFATSHPKDLSDELIKVMANGKHTTPYLHLPVQAGDNAILKKMNRRYTVAHYKNLVKKARKAIPGLMVSTDVIVGFPGETKRQFENTVKLFKEVKFDMAYIAKYSPRAGTAAAELADNVPIKEKERRAIKLNEILKKTALKNNQKILKKTVRVLVEDCNSEFCFGKTDTFKTIKIKTSQKLAGQLVKAKIVSVQAFGLGGELVSGVRLF